MKSSKQKKRYDADLVRLAESLSGGEMSFLRAFAEQERAAVGQWELVRGGLPRPQRLCAEAFAGGESFEQIAERTGYLLDDIHIYIVSAMRAAAPEQVAPAEVAVEEPEPTCEPALEPLEEPRMSRRAARQPLDAEDDAAPTTSRKWRTVALAAALAIAAVLAWSALSQRGTQRAVEEVADEIPAEVADDPALESVVEPVAESDIPPADSYAAPPDTLAATDDAPKVPSSGGRAELTSISKEADGQPTSKPQIGRREYNAYLAAAAMPLSAESRGEVTLTFRVNHYGRPSQIRVTSTLSREANHEAIRLLSGGPEWTESQRTVEITIRFN